MKALFFLIPAVFLLFPLSVTETNGDLSLQDKSVSALTDTVISHPGQVLIEQHCYSCHAPQMNGQDRLAPPIQMVKMHYTREYSSKKAFVNAIARWVENPSEEKSIMPGAINRFGLMTPYPIEEEDVRLIADYLYEADLPSIRGHRKGTMRQGRKGRGK